MKLRLSPMLAVAAAFLAGNAAHATTLQLPAKLQGRQAVVRAADTEARHFAQVMARLCQPIIAQRKKYQPQLANIPLSFPLVIRLDEAGTGVAAAEAKYRGLYAHMGAMRQAAAGDITLQFDSSGTEAFPAAYQQLLQSVFDSAKPLLDALFGSPAVPGPVHIANFDATIGDRDAVVGGYYLPNNGAGMPEIRFPIYNANETAAVNFIHCLLLAYLGPDGYSTDGFEEGLVRAITMKVIRTAGALPSTLDPTAMNNVLDSSYDVGAEYDWDNQRALSAPTFIAPNLRSLPLPASGGSGLFLMRYMMAGSAWQKVLVEYPTFPALLNQAVYANPSLGSNPTGLIAQGQTILNQLNPSNPTIEGLSFANWINRQFALSPTPVYGSRLFVQATPVTDSLSGTDFGVFIIGATAFTSDSSGNENLVSGTAYPIYWDHDFNSITTSSQDQQINIVASQGSVVPNLPDLYAGGDYRATVDVPFGDQIGREFLPVGAIATANKPTANDFAGTVEGVGLQTGDTLRVHVIIGGTAVADIPVNLDAFGGTIGTAGNFEGAASVTLQLIRTRAGTDTVLYSRVVDKGPGSLFVDLNAGMGANYTFTPGIPGGFAMVGLPVDPFTNDAASFFGQNAAGLLMARYNPSAASYDLYPTIEAPTAGHAYFVHLPATVSNFTYTGKASEVNTSTVALKPGWNMITAPVNQTIPLTSLRVVHAADFPVDYTTAAGTLLGLDFFQFQPGTPSPITGLPEGGTFQAATQFAPGVGYFVRVLSPEGVTIAFDASGVTTLSLKTSSHRSGPLISGIAPSLLWQMTVSAISNGNSSSVIVGASKNGTETFDPKIDSALPPGIGGFQLASVSHGYLYRDMRPINTTERFELQLNGLTPGKAATLRFTPNGGKRLLGFYVTNLANGQTRWVRSFAAFPFIASAATQNFVLTVIYK